MSHVYTARAAVRHHELDGFGRLHPAVYLRYLAHAAVEASSAAGFDAAWYTAAGTLWLVRRSSFDVLRPLGARDEVTIRTWVEDFRRVRSHRRYEILDAAGERCLEAVTDWVYVDAATGRPRRVPQEMEQRFGVDGLGAQERSAWTAPPAPAAPARSTHRVRVHELDALAHVNNAVYLDVAAQAMLDALEDVGWTLDRLVAGAAVPCLLGADLEYLEAARYGDRLETATWFAPEPAALAAHHVIGRAGHDRPLVRATTRWRATSPAADATAPFPAGLLAALHSLLAA